MKKNSRQTDYDDDDIPRITPGMTAIEAAELYTRTLEKMREYQTPRVTRRRGQRRGNLAASEILQSVMNDPPHAKVSAGRIDAVIEACLIDAAKGDLSAAEILIDMYNHSRKNGDFVVEEKIRYVDPPKGND